MKPFDIILTTFNRLDYTKRTIASLIASGAVKDCERFIIVDNRSTEEGFQDFLNDMYNFDSKTFIVRRGKNDGWGMAVNDALGLSRAPFLLVINNDVEFEPDFHTEMLNIIKIPVWLRPSGEVAKGIGLLGVWRHTAHGFVSPAKNGIQSTGFREMDNVPAVGWMLSKAAMMEVGMFSEHGQCFTKGGNGEDTAYVNRMKDKGWLTGVPNTDVAHHLDGY